MKSILLGLVAAALMLCSTTPALARGYRVYARYAPVYGVYRAYPARVYYPRRAYYPAYPVYPVYPAYPATYVWY